MTNDGKDSAASPMAEYLVVPKQINRTKNLRAVEDSYLKYVQIFLRRYYPYQVKGSRACASQPLALGLQHP